MSSPERIAPAKAGVDPDKASGRPFAGDAPFSLVSKGEFEFGSWNGIPGRANLLEVEKPYHYRIPDFIKKWRLKEWRTFLAGNGRWVVSASLADAKILGIASIAIWDRREKRRYGFRHIFPGRPVRFGDSLYPSHLRFAARRSRLEMTVNPELGKASIDAGWSSAKGPAMSCRLAFGLDPDSCSPFSVCHPLGMNRALYSCKILMPFGGEFVVGDESHDLSGMDSMGIMDDSKGFYPLRMRFDRVSGFGTDSGGGRVGFTLCDDQVRDQARYNENRLWIGGGVERLPPVKVTRPYGPAGDWIVQDTEGMVDLVFSPEAPHDTALRIGIAEIDFHRPFGRFQGTIRTPGGASVDAGALYGMGEENSLRI